MMNNNLFICLLNTKIRILRVDNWEALYINGKIYAQDHRIGIDDLTSALNLNYGSHYIEDELQSLFPDDQGYFPDVLPEEFK